MRIILPTLTTSFLFCVIAQAAPSASGNSSKMKEAPNHEQLSKKLRIAQQRDPLKELGPAKGDTSTDPTKRSEKRDLIASSALLCFQGQLTLVPKRAVLHFPEKLEDRKGAKPNVKVKTFQDFYSQNRGWIRTVEVTREQALGHAPIAESILTAIKESSSVVIATYKGGPISVLPEKDPEEVPTKSEMKPVIYRK